MDSSSFYFSAGAAMGGDGTNMNMKAQMGILVLSLDVEVIYLLKDGLF